MLIPMIRRKSLDQSLSRALRSSLTYLRVVCSLPMRLPSPRLLGRYLPERSHAICLCVLSDVRNTVDVNLTQPRQRSVLNLQGPSVQLQPDRMTWGGIKDTVESADVHQVGRSVQLASARVGREQK
jgi:hypothetical protein